MTSIEPNDPVDHQEFERDTTPLSLEEIEEATFRIAKLHPLKKVRVGNIFPCFRCCLRCKPSVKEETLALIEKEKED